MSGKLIFSELWFTRVTDDGFIILRTYIYNITAFYEATCLAGFSTLEARRIFKLPDYVPLAITKLLTKLEACSTTMAQKKFLQKFQELT